MNLEIKNRRVWILGAGRGLGRAIAKTLAPEVSHITLIARTESELKITADACQELGASCAFHVLDLSQSSDLQRACQLIASDAPDIVVHNIGGSLEQRSSLFTIEEFQSVFWLNFSVAAEINRHIIPQMRSRKFGRVVHISSCAAKNARGALPYKVSKAALNAYVEGLGHETIKDGVVVSSIMPGPIMVEGNSWSRRRQADPKQVENFIASSTAIGRFNDANEIASFTAFLCSNQCRLSAGASYLFDGGVF
jgi:3-oxoacyl-[acyl-carrier protein] reductase